MRGPLIAVLAGATLALTGIASASSSLRVRPVIPPADAIRAAHPGARPIATMTPDEVRAQSERLARWRSMRDLVSAPGVDHSLSAARRRGWAGTPAGARDPRHTRPARAGALPPDIVRVAFIRIDFATDVGGGASSGDGRFMLNPADTVDDPVDRPPHNRSFYASHLEALNRFYQAQSYGRVVIQGDVWPRDDNSAYRVSDMADFGPWAFSRSIYAPAVHMFHTFAFAADSQAILRGDPIPWDQYDRVCFIHAGSDLQNDVRQDSKEDIPTFTMFVGDTDRVFFKDGTTDTTGQSCDPHDPNTPCFSLDRCTFFPETINQDGYFGTVNGVIAHECGHLIFGFEDVYDFETGLPVVGEWSLMDSGNLVGSRVLQPDGSQIFATGLLPPSIDPFQRFFVGDALSFPEASVGDTMVLLDSERHPDMRSVTLSSDEYLVLENRYQLPANIVEIQTDPATHVILGPQPDSLLYDALLPGGGVLVWHIDASVLPFSGSLRVNTDYGFNTNPSRPGISVIEADGLADLGDPSSAGILGWPSDPWFKTNNAVLSDTTIPNLIPHIGTRPHVALQFLDDPDSIVRVSERRTWLARGWPRPIDAPPGGPRLLAVDADGDRNLEICWAGGAGTVLSGGQQIPNPDSSALFALRFDGTPMIPTSTSFVNLDQISMAQRGRPEGRPRPLMAALALNDPGGGLGPAVGPCWFAVSTYPAGPDTSFPGGRVWLVDTLNEALPGWPAQLQSVVTTPPVLLGLYPNAVVFVGCANGYVYALGLDGKPYGGIAPKGPLAGGVSGRLAVTGTVGSAGSIDAWVAAGGRNGDVATFHFSTIVAPSSRAGRAGQAAQGWQRSVGTAPFDPDFLWVDFDGSTPSSSRSPACSGGDPALVVHQADRLWAFCEQGDAIPGWGRSAGDTLVDALAAGDPDGDGFPEVITQTVHSKLAYWNVTGAPSPGWPVAGTREDLRTASPPLALDLEGVGRSDLLGLNGSGVIAAFDLVGRIPSGWPLATGAGATGDVVAADLDRDGSLDIVAPDRFGLLYVYSLPVTSGDPKATSWTMVGGDPGRSSSLPASRTSGAPAPAPGPLVSGSLKVYPNPARRQPVSFAYQLTEPAQVEFRIVDTSGHEVASFTRSGIQSDNFVVWDPGRLPAGLYLAQLRFRGNSGERRETLPVGVLR